MITNPNVKLNFGLNVLGRRPDGYHDIETLFFPFDEIKDTLEIVTGEDFSQTAACLFAKYEPDFSLRQGISEDGKLMITIAREEGVDWEPLDDLCAKAYRLLQTDFDLPPVKIFLEKTSPVGAGLGGGSSDGAFTLKMLNEMFALGLSEEQLASYAAKLGSDCPFFIYNRPMIGEGRGEILTPFDINLDGYDVKVVVPEGISVSTAEAYRGIAAAGIYDDSSKESQLRKILSLPVEEWNGRLKNDFETSVFLTHQSLASIKNSLYSCGAVYASMSGSGSSLFAIYKH